MKNTLNLSDVQPKAMYPLGEGFEGISPQGRKLSFTNYYMQMDGNPFFGVTGEFHFARYQAEAWEDELIKMKVGGVNIVATYVFWIHHEEEEGTFDFTGRRDLRRFIQLCQKHGLYVIARIGPFAHGEVRNGGLPDWLYGKPFEVRSTNAGFMRCTARWYGKLHEQLDGLYFGQGGPVIAAQLDNEYMHSAAPWEITTGVSGEWLTPGTEGDAYMLALLKLAKDTGIVVPFYTCTGWGGAATPKEMMPVWGGYAFRPWIFYSHKGEHPATEEYIYRDNHNDQVPGTYNFEPFYRPESKPYFCCEMGGGMTCCYYYRFQLPYESVDAMANIKLGSGCNMLGYYMYHGGANPTGKGTPFLNEGQVPKISYDYQAPLGEFGQARDSYHRLRAVHALTRGLADILCRAKTVLPENSQTIAPEDAKTLRYAARITTEGQGFLFLNNYQDHADMKNKQGESIALRLPGKELLLEGIGLQAGENCILPFNLMVAGIPLEYALAQYITHFERDGESYAFFLIPEGMRPRYVFAPGVALTEAREGATGSGGIVTVPQDGLSRFTVTYGGKRLTVVTMTRRQSLDFYTLPAEGGKAAIWTKAIPLFDEDESAGFRLEYDAPAVELSVFPPPALQARLGKPGEERHGLLGRYTFAQQARHMDISIQQVGPGRYSIHIPPVPMDVKQALLQVRYQGDIGTAFIDGRMIADNFANGALWDIGLKAHAQALQAHPLTLYIAPVRQGGAVNVESAMAGRKEEAEGMIARLESAAIRLIYEWTLY